MEAAPCATALFRDGEQQSRDGKQQSRDGKQGSRPHGC